MLQANPPVPCLVMIDLFAPEVRRNPWPVYDQLRAETPVLQVPPPFNGWMMFDYETVKWMMTDHTSFSSRWNDKILGLIYTRSGGDQSFEYAGVASARGHHRVRSCQPADTVRGDAHRSTLGLSLMDLRSVA
jgi:cytochrome P450